MGHTRMGGARPRAGRGPTAAPRRTGSGDDSAASAAVADLQRMQEASRRLIGLLDASVVARRAASVFGPIVGTDATGVSLREGPRLMVTRGSWRVRTPGVRSGLQIPYGDGVGGKVLQHRRPVSVADFETAPETSPRLVEQMVHQEGIHAILGVPIMHRGRVIGVLYALNRSAGEIGDRARRLAEEFASSLGPALGGAMHAQRASGLSAMEERQRISRDLHDTLSPLLFGIGSAAQRASSTLGATAPDVVEQIRAIEAQAAQAASSLRDILRALAPSAADEGLPAVIGMDVRGFATVTGTASDFAVIGEPYSLSGEQEAVLIAVVREGLHNVGKHAQASSVLVTLHYGEESTEIIVQDDGRGLPEGFEVAQVPRDGEHYGLASLSQRLARVGGEIALQRNDDGGMTLCGSVPTCAA
ncbi:MAG: GAF domain-containing protein [Chloroflexi bacterium]|nr:MAG: GAF domain-containing protein [Chloroflexota bacterium]